AFCNYHVCCHAARLEQSRKESRTALPRIFHVVAANLIALHSAVTKQPALRGGFGCLVSLNLFCEDQPELQKTSRTRSAGFYVRSQNVPCRQCCPTLHQ